jgi:hypothetical protein
MCYMNLHKSILFHYSTTGEEHGGILNQCIARTDRYKHFRRKYSFSFLYTVL